MKCDCNKDREECVAPVRVVRGGFYRRPDELMKCGKVIEMIKEMNKDGRTSE